jgi:hypothetical protein
MKKTRYLFDALAVVFLIAMLWEVVRRFLYQDAGDPLIPIGMVLMIFMGTAIYQQILEIRNDLLEVKAALMAVVTQSRQQVELLSLIVKFNDFKSHVQKSDLN